MKRTRTPSTPPPTLPRRLGDLPQVQELQRFGQLTARMDREGVMVSATRLEGILEKMSPVAVALYAFHRSDERPEVQIYDGYVRHDGIRADRVADHLARQIARTIQERLSPGLVLNLATHPEALAFLVRSRTYLPATQEARIQYAFRGPHASGNYVAFLNHATTAAPATPKQTGP